MKEVSVDFIKDCFDYSPQSGVITWRIRPRSHFKCERGFNLFNKRFAGKDAGTLSKTTGYVYVNLGKELGIFPAHRIAWAVFYGEWPKKHIDHIDKNRCRNQIDNLRQCERSENQCNRGAQSNNTSGLKGAHKHFDGRWRAKINKNGKSYSFGVYDTPQAAHEAYLKAARKLHGEFATT